MTAHRIPVTERRARLGQRHGLAPGHGHPDVESSASALVGLHASDPATTFLAARARVGGFVPADLEDALYERRTLSKHLCMRGTLFVVPTDLLAVVHAATTSRIAPAQRRRLVRGVEDGGVTDDGERWLRSAESQVLDALDRLGPSTGAALAREIPALQAQLAYGEGKSWGGTIGVSTRVFSQLAMEGRIRRGRPTAWTSSQHLWERVDRPIDPLGGPGATAELVRHWLAAFGPGTLEDVTWWTGLGVTRVRSGLASVDAVEVDLDGEVGFVLPDDLELVADPGPWVALLPSLDPTAMGWKRREWYLGGHDEALFDRNGNIGPTVWSDGRVVGGWAQADTGEVRYRLLEDLGTGVEDEVAAQAAALGEWLGDVVVKPRFPTPLQRELRS